MRKALKIAQFIIFYRNCRVLSKNAVLRGEIFYFLIAN